ncbi:MAG: DUF1538 domain-containing protein [Clostridiales bacterium]|nr:DUF1538 domain-containing protein [Clostridiales bacterium]MDY3746710.1 DUF1538 domain-containing protein [Lachnospiraceae bacterium]
MNRQLKGKINESLASVLPITMIVLILGITAAPIPSGILVLFLFGALMLIGGMGIFTLGADISMIPMGDGIGVQISKAKKLVVPIVLCFTLGVVVTIAEPDLQVLAEQIPAIPNMVLILSVAVGVGCFLVISLLRIVLKIRLSYVLIFFYTIVFIMAFLAPEDFIPAAFDSGGVTTGPMTVPFIMSLGIGMASIRSDKGSADDSFGLVSLCSIGPIISVLLLGIIYKPESAVYSSETVIHIETTRDAAIYFLHEFPEMFREVAISLLPIVIIFCIFQLAVRRYHRHQVMKIISGFIYTYVGLVLFLVGANVGFMPMGQYLGETLASSEYKLLLIPVGMVIGYFIVSAEPAVHVLKKQVEEVSNGSISQKMMGRSLSLGVAVSVGIAMLRILTGISILWFLIPGYAISLMMTFFVPSLFTGIAFDSGGVASGPMTATFLLPLSMGACSALGGNIMTDAFGIIAMVAMTPLITIQMLGAVSVIRTRKAQKYMEAKVSQVEDCIVYFED